MTNPDLAIETRALIDGRVRPLDELTLRLPLPGWTTDDGAGPTLPTRIY
ncbi:hypothetical protein N4G69_53285 [Streptomyces mirabilis]|nr:hypothetical protein [Streptomyces mirabilis]MCT9114119.1 hypothetical protein [Streptomyces mirabilis]